MASAYLHGNRWRADFRGLLQVGSQRRRVSVPLDQMRRGHEEADARAFACECARLCRLCEGIPALATIERAEALGAITSEQASALRTGKRPAPPVTARRALTILEAARAHPSTGRETPHSQAEHEGYVGAFVAWAGDDRLDGLTIERTTGWISEMERRGWAYDTRRHALLWLRRASRMAAAQGLPDPLSRLTLDRRGHRPTVRAWSYADLVRLLQGARAARDRRLEALVLLCGWCGLRESEALRAQVGDLDADGVLAVGERAAKNAASRRRLPLPPQIVGVLRDLAHNHAPDAHLLRPASTRTASRPGKGFDARAFARWYRRAIWGDRPTGAALTAAVRAPAPPIPRTGPMPAPSVLGALPSSAYLPPKALRKSFLSWAIRAGLPQQLTERWAGHTLGGMLAVTERHYYADLQVAELRPLGEAIGRALDAIVATNCPGDHKSMQ